MKNILVFFLFLFCLAIPTQALAAAEIRVSLNEQPMNFDDVPQIIEDRTFVPMRALLEALGAQVDWDSANRQAIGVTSSMKLQMIIGSPQAYINGAAFPLEDRDKARLLNDRTYLPLRFVSEGMGYDVEWVGETRTILISDPKKPIPTRAEDLTIQGRAYIPQDAMQRWFDRNIPDYAHLPALYYEMGRIYNVRPDLAIAQAIHETGYFRYGNEVQAHQNNYCGLYATGVPISETILALPDPIYGANPERVWLELGQYGAFFTTPRDGVEAHIQHLYGYATTDPLPKGIELVSPRFRILEMLGRRGSAPTLATLGPQNPTGGGWATDISYVHKVESVFVRMLSDMRLLPREV